MGDAMRIKLHLRTKEAANYLCLSESLLEKLRFKGGGPRYAKLGRLVVYTIADLDDWVGAHKRISTLDLSAEAEGSHVDE